LGCFGGALGLGKGRKRSIRLPGDAISVSQHREMSYLGYGEA
jgi:hypothetical protein